MSAVACFGCAGHSDRWGTDEGPAPSKTVWAEVDLDPERSF
ncbi:hypothetical protein OG800_36240 [Streptomyces sp. NBC_00445]